MKVTLLPVLIFAGLSSMVACGNSSDTASKTAKASVGGCKEGESKPAGDSCNTCTCTSDGMWACTEMACADSQPDPSEAAGERKLNEMRAQDIDPDVWGGLVKEGEVPDPKAQGVAPPAPALSRDEIRTTVRTKSTAYRSCYEEELAKHPGLSGTLKVSFQVTREGGVTNAIGMGFANENVTSCVVKAIETLKFPESKGGEPMKVQYPFTFKPS